MYFEHFTDYLPPTDPLHEQLADFVQIREKLDRVNAFADSNNVLPHILIEPILKDMKQLVRYQDVEPATSSEQLLKNELIRKTLAGMMQLEQRIDGRSPTFSEMMQMYGIDLVDFQQLEDWLQNSKSDVEHIIQSLFATQPYKMVLDVPYDVTQYRRRAEEFIAHNIEEYNPHLHELFCRMYGDFIPEYTIEPTTLGRSYFRPSLNYAALSISAVCTIIQSHKDKYNSPIQLNLDLERLLELWGHEVVGHAVVQQNTAKQHLPSILATSTTATIAAQESVAQHYEYEFLKRLGEHSDLLERLGIGETYGEIIHNYKNETKIGAYLRKMSHFMRYVLADPDRKFGENPQDKSTIEAKKEKIRQHALDPRSADRVVEGARHSYRSDGGLNQEVVSELRYFPDPVSKVLKLGERYGIPYEGYVNRMLIDRLLLSGFWTPAGLLEYANLAFAEISGMSLLSLADLNKE